MPRFSFCRPFSLEPFYACPPIGFVHALIDQGPVHPGFCQRFLRLIPGMSATRALRTLGTRPAWDSPGALSVGHCFPPRKRLIDQACMANQRLMKPGSRNVILPQETNRITPGRNPRPDGRAPPVSSSPGGPVVHRVTGGITPETLPPLEMKDE